MSDTEPSELDPERETLPPSLSLAEEVRELQRAIVDSNELSVLARDASEKCTNRLIALGQRLLDGDARFAKIERRLGRIERKMGIEAEP